MEIAPLAETNHTVNETENDVKKWSKCITTEFPIATVEKRDSKVILSVGPPNQGCFIISQMENDKLHGESIIQSADNIVIAEFVYDDGEITGPCKLYYSSGDLYFEGELVKGLRQGMGQEYDENGDLVYEGPYRDGYKIGNYVVMDDMKGYLKEIDVNGNTLSVVQLDSEGNLQGKCYFFSNGSIEHISMYKDNKEVSLLAKFHDDIMTEYQNGVRRYEGTYYGSVESGFFRCCGVEYDNTGKKIIYDGDFVNDRKSGLRIFTGQDGSKVSRYTSRNCDNCLCVFFFCYLYLIPILSFCAVYIAFMTI